MNDGSGKRSDVESFLLFTLQEISQLVAHSHDPKETLENIVRLIQGRCHTDVCSVYLYEPDQAQLVLAATVGLRDDAVGRVRMRLDEGLTGLVAELLEPVAVSEAEKHPRYKYFPEAGEERYHSFLGVPLVERGVFEGVLVVQTTSPRQFTTNEARMLVTVATQLVPLVTEARLLEHVVADASRPAPTKERVVSAPSSLNGMPISSGTGWVACIW